MSKHTEQLLNPAIYRQLNIHDSIPYIHDQIVYLLLKML